MNEYTATEQAFKNGYNQGRSYGIKVALKAVLELHKECRGKRFGWAIFREKIYQLAKDMGVEL